MKSIFTFFCIFGLVIFLFLFLTKKYVNPYKLYLFFGKKGCGKSTLLQKLVSYYSKRGYTCYCNIGDSTLPNVIPIHIEDLPQLSMAYKNPTLKDPLIRKYYKLYVDPSFDIKNGKLPQDIKLPVPVSVKPHSVIFCDEINLLWDNRDFKSFPKDMQKYFRLQRHYKHIFIGFSQTYDCDKKIRDLADELTKFLDAGILVPQDGQLVLDQRMVQFIYTTHCSFLLFIFCFTNTNVLSKRFLFII